MTNMAANEDAIGADSVGPESNKCWSPLDLQISIFPPRNLLGVPLPFSARLRQ